MIDSSLTLDFSAGDDRVRLIVESDQPWTDWEMPITVVAHAGLFHGQITASMGLASLEELHAIVVGLEQAVGHSHHAQWQPTGHLSLTFDLSHIGHVHVGVQLEDLGTGSILTFSIRADQTYLRLWISEAKRVLRHFSGSA